MVHRSEGEDNNSSIQVCSGALMFIVQTCRHVSSLCLLCNLILPTTKETMHIAPENNDCSLTIRCVLIKYLYIAYNYVSVTCPIFDSEEAKNVKSMCLTKLQTQIFTKIEPVKDFSSRVNVLSISF